MSDQTRMTLLHSSTNNLVEELLMWRGRAAELLDRIAELEVMVKGHDPFEDFPSKERGFECSVLVLGRFEWEEEYQPMSNWDLCRYWFDEQKWFAINGYLCEDDIVAWYPLPEGE